MNTYTIHDKAGLKYINVDRFSELSMIKHGISTRIGGVSSGYYESLNLGLMTEDSKENVKENYRRICEAIGVDDHSLVRIFQTHNEHIKVVDDSFKSHALEIPDHMYDFDGLMTNVPGVTLVTTYADCVPLMFLDPIKKVIAMSHAGWRGTVKQIGVKTVRKMAEEYGSKPKDILVAIGPSIGPDHFEVGQEVYDSFDKAFNRDIMGKIAQESLNMGHLEHRYKINLWEANRLPLLEAGIDNNHITVIGLCTMCRQDLFFSHRASKGIRGSMVAMMALKA